MKIRKQNPSLCLTACSLLTVWSLSVSPPLSSPPFFCVRQIFATRTVTLVLQTWCTTSEWCLAKRGPHVTCCTPHSYAYIYLHSAKCIMHYAQCLVHSAQCIVHLALLARWGLICRGTRSSTTSPPSSTSAVQVNQLSGCWPVFCHKHKKNEW